MKRHEIGGLGAVHSTSETLQSRQDSCQLSRGIQQSTKTALDWVLVEISVDMANLRDANHLIKALIHEGQPECCESAFLFRPKQNSLIHPAIGLYGSAISAQASNNPRIHSVAFLPRATLILSQAVDHTLKTCFRTMESKLFTLMPRTITLLTTSTTPSLFGSFEFTCRNCGGGDRGRVAIYRPFGEFLRA
ncbi:hypothetical protein TNCV_2437831 [Trichonephila clavipes]|nr:hypothetical protein TNCV_2437831 [Trichonephila clavipes]